MDKQRYKVLKNGEEIFIGTGVEVRSFLGMHKQTGVATYCNKGYTYNGIYTFEKVNMPNKPRQDYIEFIISHFKRYGNVSISQNPEDYREELESLGYEFDVKEYVWQKNTNIVIDEGRGFQDCICECLEPRTDYVLTWRNYGKENNKAAA